MENREKFSSRLGFLLISAGCAIGLGNVWKFPYITGKYGGAAFVLIYFVFLLILGIPILTLELAVGRASQRSVALSMDVLEPKGTKWHWFKFPAMAGNYILMMFYTTVAGWMVYYFFKMAAGGFVGMNADEIGATFNSTLANPTLNVAFMIAVVISCMLIVGKGLQNGVEKITKVMMIALLVLMIVLAVRSFFLAGGEEGLRFYLYPDFSKLMEYGITEVLFAAMSQAFFTLSIGMGAIAIFGSFIDRSRSLMGEAICITILDTAVALMAGLIIFPACFAYGVDPGQARTDFRDAPQRIQCNAGRSALGDAVLPVHVLCGILYGHRCIPEPDYLLDGYDGCAAQENCCVSYCGTDCALPALRAGLQRAERLTALGRGYCDSGSGGFPGFQ